MNKKVEKINGKIRKLNSIFWGAMVITRLRKEYANPTTYVINTIFSAKNEGRKKLKNAKIKCPVQLGTASGFI